MGCPWTCMVLPRASVVATDLVAAMAEVVLTTLGVTAVLPLVVELASAWATIVTSPAITYCHAPNLSTTWQHMKLAHVEGMLIMWVVKHPRTLMSLTTMMCRETKPSSEQRRVPL